MTAKYCLHIHKNHAGSLLKSTGTRMFQSMQVCDRKDFSEGCHMASTESYFYDAAYQPVNRDHAIPIDECGRCILANLFAQKQK